jgi:mRNA interferase MazF
MKEGDVVVAAMPQIDGQVKNRPVLLLRQFPPFGDWLVCGISSQQRQLARDLDELLTSTDVDFGLSGLRKPSVIRLTFLALFDTGHIKGRIGSVSKERHKKLLQKLATYLISDLVE